ncbi:septal ring lytic transglycosylase RlpA family protein [Altererythrobacter sp. KTW20L]|uniref:septal ring lytic transglycosylase RlpA family protein n=1 Tax=Altererythrobacter sp. KTW20L TaxID=2942210 RepID=UPI0020BFB8F3|nr:septal ring lytic transglycosylase RlpA family protein [Altererythrobacter sp. KTW20L]MCL6251746.1 septal ring lytic transglycosylase RlpA family protein [Altererythrobacter sp. KTW20L]
MTGPEAPRPRATRTQVRWLLALSATVALGVGLGTAGQAQVSTETAALAPAVAATTPPALRFQPSAEAAAELAAPVASPLATPLGTGSASYYADKFHGRRTASGEAFDQAAYTAAHRTLPFGSLVRVTNEATGASVVVRINDRGPFIRGREIDVSRAAAEELGLIRPGHAEVALELLED